MADRVKSIVIKRLRDAGDAGLSGATTPESRLALVDALTREAWSLAGLDVPSYHRSEAPISVRPLRDTQPRERFGGR